MAATISTMENHHLLCSSSYHVKIKVGYLASHTSVTLNLKLCNFYTGWLPLQFFNFVDVVDMADNGGPFDNYKFKEEWHHFQLTTRVVNSLPACFSLVFCTLQYFLGRVFCSGGFTMPMVVYCPYYLLFFNEPIPWFTICFRKRRGDGPHRPRGMGRAWGVALPMKIFGVHGEKIFGR